MDILVTDADGNHALSVVRSLGRQGLRVAAADSMWWAKAFFSRYCKQTSVYPSPTRSIGEFNNRIRHIVKSLRPALLMPMTERTILALTSNLQENAPELALAPLPPLASLRIAFNKKSTVELAKTLDIEVPDTISPAKLPDFSRLGAQLSYPVVIKPQCSESVTSDDRIVAGGTVEYCMHAGELETKYLRIHQRTPLPLIQAFVPGEGYGICVICKHGKIKALFAHRRLRTVHPTGSGSSLRESIVPPADMVEATRKLLEALEWHGVAMVEFKRDTRDGKAKLMEINGRFWNSLPLAVAAGVDFPSLLYKLATTNYIPSCFDYRIGVKCRWLAGDIGHLLRVFRGPPPGWTDTFPSRGQTLKNFMKFYERDLHYDNPWLSDPLPFLAEIGGQLISRFPKSFMPRRHTAEAT